MCNCIENINKQLEKRGENTRLDVAIFMNGNPPRVKITTCRRDPNNHRTVVFMLPTYCPFCGKEYDSIGGRLGGWIPKAKEEK